MADPRRPFTLSQRDKKELRGRAQRLKPSVHLGRNGLTEPALSELDRALAKDLLIKVRLETDRATMKAWIPEIEAATGAVCVGIVGFTAAFYRHSKQEKAASVSAS